MSSFTFNEQPQTKSRVNKDGLRTSSKGTSRIMEKLADVSTTVRHNDSGHGQCLLCPAARAGDYTLANGAGVGGVLILRQPGTVAHSCKRVPLRKGGFFFRCSL